jgi:hypothetical protein
MRHSLKTKLAACLLLMNAFAVKSQTMIAPGLPSLPVTDGLDWTAGASRHYGLLEEFRSGHEPMGGWPSRSWS